MNALVARVRGLLREQRPGWMDERAARSDLYPAARLIDVAPASPPFNQPRPSTLATADGARGESVFEDGNSTG